MSCYKDRQDSLLIHVQAGILHNFLTANGAIILSEDEMRNRAIHSNLEVTIVVPHDFHPSKLKRLQSEDFYEDDDRCVNDFWVEKCLHLKTLVDRNNIQCQPFDTFPIIGMLSPGL